MTGDLTFFGGVLISSCIIAGGILIGAMAFAIPIPYSSYAMVMLAILVVIGAAVLILSSKGSVPSQQ